MAIGLTYSNYRVLKWYLMKKYWWFFREFETRWFPIFNRGVCGVLPWRLLFPLWLIGPVQCGHWHIFYRGAPCTLHLIFYTAGTWYFTLWILDLKELAPYILHSLGSSNNLAMHLGIHKPKIFVPMQCTWYFTLECLNKKTCTLHLKFYTVWDTWGFISPKISFRRSPSKASTLAPLVMKDEFTSKSWPAEKV